MKKPPGGGTGGFSGEVSVAQRTATSNQPRTPAVPCELKIDKSRMADILSGENGYAEGCQANA
jgi:hypothetical protein